MLRVIAFDSGCRPRRLASCSLGPIARRRASDKCRARGRNEGPHADDGDDDDDVDCLGRVSARPAQGRQSRS